MPRQFPTSRSPYPQSDSISWKIDDGFESSISSVPSFVFDLRLKVPRPAMHRLVADLSIAREGSNESSPDGKTLDEPRRPSVPADSRQKSRKQEAFLRQSCAGVVINVVIRR